MCFCGEYLQQTAGIRTFLNMLNIPNYLIMILSFQAGAGLWCTQQNHQIRNNNTHFINNFRRVFVGDILQQTDGIRTILFGIQ